MFRGLSGISDNKLVQVVDAVHEQGSFIYLQIWAMGRMARPPMFPKDEADIPYVAPSPIPLPQTPDVIPREMTKKGK